jgi:hypothetical protein
MFTLAMKSMFHTDYENYANVLIAIVKQKLQIRSALYICLRILSVSIFEKTELSCAL